MGIVSSSPVVSSRAPEYPRNTQLGKEDFLRLLVAQLQHQDPLNPMNSTEFTAQLAQFSALEQQRNTNENLEKLIERQEFLARVNVAGLMGKEVLAYNNELLVDKPGPVEITFELPQDAKSAQVTITDPAGRLIRSLSTSNAKKGFNTVTWDGKTESGQIVPTGTYYFAVSGILKDKSTIAGQPCAKGKIEEVKYKNGRPYFSVGGREIAMDQVVKIMEPSREY